MCKLFQKLFGKKDPRLGSTPTPDEDVIAINSLEDEDLLIDPTPLITYPLKTSEADGVALYPGMEYVVTYDDIETQGETMDYECVAENHGMHESTLSAFNDNKIFRVNDTIYIPSVEELCFYEYCLEYIELGAAKNHYLQMDEWPNKKLLIAARYRGAGKIGKSYGTSSPVFLSPNTDLVGAVEHRSEIIDGNKVYQVNWGPDLWKCNIFMHDSVYFAGYQPDVMANQHYITAGNLHKSNLYQQLKVEEVTPGCIVQLYNGSGSNDSHNMILMSFIQQSRIDEKTEKWIFKAMGAEADRAAVSYRQHFIDLDTDNDYYKVREDLDSSTRKYIRMFKPLYKREMV